MRSERFARCFTMMCKACAIDSDWNLSKKIDVRQLLKCLFACAVTALLPLLSFLNFEISLLSLVHLIPSALKTIFPFVLKLTIHPRTMLHCLTYRFRRLANSAAALLPKKRPNRPPNLALLLLPLPPPMPRKVTAATTMTATTAVRFLRVVC